MKSNIKNILVRVMDVIGVDKSAIKKIIYGYSMAFNECDIITSFIFKYNVSGVVIDVGFFNGRSSQKLLNKGWVVHGFEPDLDDYKRNSIKKLCKKKNFVFDDRAVSNKSGEKLCFYTSSESRGISSLHAFTSGHKKSHEVNTVSLTDYVEEKNIYNISFLKIDTEGHDLYVLQGFPFYKMRPKIVLCEFEDRKTKGLGYTYTDMVEFMMNYDYKVFLFEWYPVQKYGGKHLFRRVTMCPCDLIDDNATGNLMAIRDDYVDSFFEYFMKQEVIKYWEGNMSLMNS